MQIAKACVLWTMMACIFLFSKVYLFQTSYMTLCEI